MVNSTVKAFNALNDMRGGNFTLTGDLVFIQMFDEEITTKSGIVLQEDADQMIGVNADKPTLGVVLMTGEGHYDDDTKEDVPLDVKPGDVVMVGKHAVKLISKFGPVLLDKVGYIKADQIQMHFKGQDAFDKACDVLSKALG